MAAVQWFPGHMAKTTKFLKENLRRVDLVIEVLDARAPQASANPLLRDLIKDKPRLILLNKEDLADPQATGLWMKAFLESGGGQPVRVSASTRRGLRVIPESCRSLCEGKSWLNRRPVRALIAGIPNVGKSTIINALGRRRQAEAGATPGLTQDFRRIPVSRQLELFDTPGLLWHKFEEPLTGIKVAALGAVKETILPGEEVALGLLSYLSRCYPRRLVKRYTLEEEGLPSVELFHRIGRGSGCLLSGGRIDTRRTSGLILKDLREGRLGRISLERPGIPDHSLWAPFLGSRTGDN